MENDGRHIEQNYSAMNSPQESQNFEDFFTPQVYNQFGKDNFQTEMQILSEENVKIKFLIKILIKNNI